MSPVHPPGNRVGIPVVVLLGNLVAVARAAVIAHLWQWFVADTWHLPRVGVVPLTGILFILGFASYYLSSFPTSDPRPLTWGNLAERFTSAFMIAGLAWLSGLILVQFR